MRVRKLSEKTYNDRLGVGEDCGDFVASRALDIHEVGVRVLNQTL